MIGRTEIRQKLKIKIKDVLIALELGRRVDFAEVRSVVKLQQVGYCIFYTIGIACQETSRASLFRKVRNIIEIINYVYKSSWNNNFNFRLVFI